MHSLANIRNDHLEHPSSDSLIFNETCLKYMILRGVGEGGKGEGR